LGLVFVPGIVALAFLIYTTPLIVDQRRHTWSALRESVRMVAAHAVYPEMVVVIVGAAVVAGAWAAAFVVLSGRLLPPLDTSQALTGSTRLLAFVAFPLAIALAVSVTCAVVAVLVAAAYLQATTAARSNALPLFAPPTTPPVATQPLAAPQAVAMGGVFGAAAAHAPAGRAQPPRARWPLALAVVLVVLLGALAASVWWVDSVAYGSAVGRSLAPGDRVTLRSGLSLVMPDGNGWSLYYASYRRPSWLHVGEDPAAESTGYSAGWKRADQFNADLAVGLRQETVMSLSFYDARSSWLRQWSAMAPVVLESPDGTVLVRWKPSMPDAEVYTRLPGHLPGWLRVVWHVPNRPRSVADVRLDLHRFWTEFSVQGAPLPTQTT
jgi:hypothetical protein